MTEQEEELQEFTPHGFNSFVTIGKQFKCYKRNTKKTEFSVVLCLVASYIRINRREMPFGSCAFSFSHKFSFTFTDMQQMRKSGHVCIPLELCLGLSISPDAFFCPANTVNWVSKHNQTTCQACLWFAPVEGCFFWGFTELLPCQHAPRLHHTHNFSREKSAVAQAVFCGPHAFSTWGKESCPTLQEHLIQTHTLLLARGLVQGKDFTRNCQWPHRLPLSQPKASCLSVTLQRSSPGEQHGVGMVCRRGGSAAAVIFTLKPS